LSDEKSSASPGSPDFNGDGDPDFIIGAGSSDKPAPDRRVM
jgi:hypothetical protein